MSKEYRQFEGVLKNNGYIKIRSNGDHNIFSNGKNTISINKKPNKMVVKRLIKENGLEVDDGNKYKPQ